MYHSMGHSVCQPPAQVMRLRRAVLKIPSKSSVPPRSPLYKLRPLLTPSESTLPQVLIPIDFKSFISNTYKKPGVGCFRPAPKFGNSSLCAHRSCAHTQTPATPIRSMVYFTTPCIPVVGDLLFHSGTGHETRNTGHVPFPQPPPLPLPVIPRGSGDLLFSSASRTTDHDPQTTRVLCAPQRYPRLCVILFRFSLPGAGLDSLPHYFLTSLLHRATVLKKG